MADVSVHLTVTPTPPQVGPATVVVRLADADGRPITGATVKLEGNMNHAGMVPVFATAQETIPGRYEATLHFTMAGDWFVVVHAHFPDGRTVARAIDVPGVQGRWTCPGIPVREVQR